MMGHNITNSRSLRSLPLDQELTIIDTILKIIEQATGKKVRGWLGTGLSKPSAPSTTWQTPVSSTPATGTTTMFRIG